MTLHSWNEQPKKIFLKEFRNINVHIQCNDASSYHLLQILYHWIKILLVRKLWILQRTLQGSCILMWHFHSNLTIPPRAPPPPLHQLLRNHFNLGWWSSSGSDRGITYFSMATRNTMKGVGGKNKEQMNNMAWVSSTCKKRVYVTLHSLCICRLTLTCSFCKISTRYEECWLILTGLPSLMLDLISCRLVSSAVQCRLLFSIAGRELTSLGSFVELLTQVLFLLPVASRSQVQTLCLVLRQNRKRNRLLGKPPT